ncbi:MAG TPA: hypothetical protein VIV60_08555 [Polyangiaceae bacterium]
MNARNRTAPRLFAALLTLTLPGYCYAQAAQPDPYGNSSSSGLQAGGLAPPGVGSSPNTTSYDPNAASTEQKLREADEKDSGRGLEFVWLNAELGYQVVGLQTFSKNNLVDASFSNTHQSGLVLGAGLGLRLLFLTIGPRFRLGNFSAWQMWSADLEAGLHLPLGRVEPYFTGGFGYTSIGAFDAKNTAVDLNGAGVNIRGWDARLGFGLDVYVTNVVTIGANLTGDGLFLKRVKRDAAPKVSCANPLACTATEQDAQQKLDAVYKNDGTSIGGAMTATAVVGLHF